jgi:two-component system sensor histidine kinase CreC
MSRRKRLFFGIVALFALGIILLLYRVASDLDSRYRESTEETLVDVAYLLAAAIETDIRKNTIDATHLEAVFQAAYQKNFDAKIFGVTKHRVDFRVYVTDTTGRVIFDSTGKASGQDFSQWNDVSRVLKGEYGARTSLENPKNPASAVMYVAAPVMHEGTLLGVVSVGKPTASHVEFVANARQKLVYVGLIAVVAFLFFLIVLSVWLTRPFGLTSDLVRILRQDGLHHPAIAWKRTKAVIRANFNDMRDVLAGRSFTEEYIQTLTHELKSPLSAIRGAAELLREPLPEIHRERFSNHIREQVQRLQDLADRLLQLASLEKQRTLEQVQAVDLLALMREAVDAIQPAAQIKQITFNIEAPDGVSADGDRFLLYQAFANILANAVDFAPAGSIIDVTIRAEAEEAEFQVRDRGPGIPDFAINRVFEKFYSLPRPDSGRKSTGLGLAFVREIAQLHGGKVSINNRPDGGALAAFRIPLARS